MTKARTAAATIVMSLVAFFGSGCSGCPGVKHEPKLSAAYVLELAQTAATEAGIDLDKFDSPRVTFELGSHDCSWLVFYEKRGEIVTMHSDLFISVSDINGFVEMRGQR